MKKQQLINLLEERSINFWELVKNEYYIKDIVSTIKSLQKKGIIDIKNSVLSLRNIPEKNTTPTKLRNSHVPKITVPNFDLKKYRQLRKKFPLSDNFDQQLLTDEAIATKLKIMSEQGDLENKNIVCIGDDDMFAIALALTKLPKSITVLDIDERIIDYENKILKDLGYPNSCIKTDLLKPLNSDLCNKFDIFECEPPDNLKGHRLFISRGVQLLKSTGGIGYTGICDQTLSKIKRATIVFDIKKMGGTICDVWEHCKPYETVGDEFNWVLNLPEGVTLPTEPWFNSNLIRIRFSAKKKPLIKHAANLSYLTELSRIRL